MLKITAYAERLLEDLEDLDWPESMTLQEALETVERNLLTRTRERYRSQAKIAEVLGVNQSTIARKQQRLIVNTVGGADDAWSPSQAQNLTYCVSKPQLRGWCESAPTVFDCQCVYAVGQIRSYS